MKVLIIEDEERAARRLEKLIYEIDDSIEVLGKIDSIDSVVQWFGAKQSCDLVFMDIHLADGSAFEIFNLIKVRPPVIFTTAYDHYAVEAFKVNAIDYLLKPIKKEELEAAISKFSSKALETAIDYNELIKQLHKEKSKGIRRFLIRIGKSFKTINIENTVYFYTENKITFLVADDGKKYSIDYSLEKLEEDLNPDLFFRINRQIIVSIKAISKMMAVSKSRVKVFLEPISREAIVSTERSSKFKKWLTGNA